MNKKAIWDLIIKKSWSLKIVLDTVHVIKQLPTGKFKLLISIDFYFFYIFIWDLDFPLPSKIKQLILVSNAETFYSRYRNGISCRIELADIAKSTWTFSLSTGSTPRHYTTAAIWYRLGSPRLKNSKFKYIIQLESSGITQSKSSHCLFSLLI